MWLYDWSEEGLEIQCIGDDILGKLVPPHVNIFYCFGGVVSLLLLFQVSSNQWSWIDNVLQSKCCLCVFIGT